MINTSKPMGLLTSLAIVTSPMVLSHCTQTASGSPVQTERLTRFDMTVSDLRISIDTLIESGVDVPVPTDAGGGYTHEQHKQNGKTIYEAAMLFRITGEERYRDFAVSILEDYAALYPTIGLHPQQKEQTPGRLFWQSLNEAVWLVYVIQGYEVIADGLDTEARERIENNVLLPMANFLSSGQPETFNKIHNHGTWAAAAVGMTGYVLGREDFVEQALMGLDRSGEGGFLRQLDELFSPDGYYAEGPYYQRFALMPFVLFANAIEENEPERGIFQYRDGVLLKAVYATIQQSYDGRFFPINDAIREKGLNTPELRYALAITYNLTGDTSLLDIAEIQNGVVPTPLGQALASDLAEGLATPFQFRSMMLRDGAEGDQGALIVLRSGPERDAAAVVFKPTSQGLGHGHFDRLGIIYYDNTHEIVADYGASRFLNVEPKEGGRYLPENTSWAKQTIAHNTLVVDMQSQYGGDWQTAQEFAPDILAFDTIDGVQFAAAQVDTAYDGVNLQRVVAMAPNSDGGQYIIDIFRARSDGSHTYDLPVHFNGQLIETGFEMSHAVDRLEPFGSENGYQHLWHRAISERLTGVSDMSWLLDDQFYTLNFTVNAPYTAHLTELGANDPNHNLRREQALIVRSESEDIDFMSVYERHGEYDSDEEVTVFDGGSVQDLEITSMESVQAYTLTPDTGERITVFIADDVSPEVEHSASFQDETFNWVGPVHIHRQ